MALGDNDQPQAEIERPLHGRDAKGSPGRLCRFDVWRRADPDEAGLQRRARRLALAAMVASSLLSLLILYGLWLALRVALRG